jgi:hypothetical protein
MQKLGMNPWVTMWASPRRTIRAVVDSNPKNAFFLLAAINFLQGFFYFNGYFSLSISYRFAISVIIAVVLSPVIGAIWCYFFGWLVFMVGKRLNGQGVIPHIIASYVWSRLPLTINLFMWFVLLVFSSGQMFIQYTEGLSLFFINCTVFITGIWSLILMVQALAEVQRYSLVRSFINIAISYVIIILIVVVVRYTVLLIEYFIR